jgi:hypothetical protein
MLMLMPGLVGPVRPSEKKIAGRIMSFNGGGGNSGNTTMLLLVGGIVMCCCSSSVAGFLMYQNNTFGFGDTIRGLMGQGTPTDDLGDLGTEYVGDGPVGDAPVEDTSALVPAEVPASQVVADSPVAPDPGAPSGCKGKMYSGRVKASNGSYYCPAGWWDTGFTSNTWDNPKENMKQCAKTQECAQWKNSRAQEKNKKNLTVKKTFKSAGPPKGSGPSGGGTSGNKTPIRCPKWQGRLKATNGKYYCPKGLWDTGIMTGTWPNNAVWNTQQCTSSEQCAKNATAAAKAAILKRGAKSGLYWGMQYTPKVSPGKPW